jgi:hypothetical protein
MNANPTRVTGKLRDREETSPNPFILYLEGTLLSGAE